MAKHRAHPATRIATQFMGSLTCVAIALMPASAAYADIVPATDGGGAQITATTVATDASKHATVSTTTVAGNVALNAFKEFSIGDTVVGSATVVQPSGTDYLINVVDNPQGQATQINGVLDFTKQGDPTSVNSSSVFFLDHNGLIVGSSGQINANTLVLSTATRGFGQRLLAGDTAAVTALENGTEDLNPAAAVTLKWGSRISARALELHAGGNLILDGTITVSDPGASGTRATRPAVNTDGLAKASGARVQGGVIYFGAGGTTRVRGNIRAQRGTAGGQIVGRSGGNMTVASGARLDVSGAAHDAGLIFLKTGGDYSIDRTASAGPAVKLDIEAGTQMLAASTGGAGGFVYASAPDVDWAGQLGLSGTTRGAALVYGAQTRVTGDVSTQGGDLTLVGDRKIDVLAGSKVNTAGGAQAGDLILATQGQIDIATGAELLADAAGAGNGGMVGLFARRVSTPSGWRPDKTYDADVGITLTGATLKAGAVVISASARASNTVDDVNAAAVEAAAQGATTTRADGSTVPSMQAAMDLVLEQAKDAARRGRDNIVRKLPIDMKNSSAGAQISITTSTLTARGNWARAAGLPLQTPAKLAQKGYLTASGVQMRDYVTVSHALAPRSVTVPVSFDPTKASLYVHADAQTQTQVKPLTKALSLGQSVTDTKATVRIEGSDLLAMDKDVQLAATLHDNIDVKLAGQITGRAGAAALISRQNSIAQLLVLGGSTTATTGDLRAAALSGKSLSHTNTLTAAAASKVATAVSVSLGRSLTENSVGGTITAGAVDLDAETIFFKKRYETIVKMGGSSSAPTNTSGAGSDAAATGGQQQASAVLGNSASRTTAGGRAFGLAVDVQIDRHQTYASLGGSYRDLRDGQAVKTHQPVTLTARDAVSVDAQQRFARYLEGGRAMSRKVQTNVTTGSAMVTAFSLAQMDGQVRAEIGAAATVEAEDVSVRGLTEYQTVAQLTNFKTRWQLFRDQLSAVTATGLAGARTQTMPDVTVSSVENPAQDYVFLTSLVGNKSAFGTVPGNTMGMTLNMFETENSTEAVILDGAQITSRTALNVAARQEAVFTHFGSDAKKGRGALATSGGAAPLIGANVSVPRMISRVVADVGDARIRATGDVTIDARNDVIQLGAVRAGGSAQSLAFNGAVSANVFETETRAGLGENADLRADTLLLRAVDDSMVISLAGANSSSAGKSVGVSAAINLVKRDTRARIGLGAPAVSAGPTANVIQTTSLRIEADNTGFAFGAAFAGTKTAGAAAGGAATNDQPAIPAGMLSSDESAAVSAQSARQTRAGATGASGGFGLSLSAASALNLLRQNDAQATLVTGGQVTITNTARVSARNTAKAVGLAGGAAMGRAGDSLAGAVVVTTDARDTKVQIRDARLTAGSVELQAQDSARAIGLAMGGSLTIAGRGAIAGSVVTQIESGDTLVDLSSAQISGDQITVDATNDGRLIGFAGAVSVATGGSAAAVGLSAVVNDSDRDATTALRATQLTAQNGATLRAQQGLRTFALGASGGVLARISLAGAAAVNTVEGAAKVTLDSSQVDVSAGDLEVQARSAARLQAYAGNGALGAKVGVGPALAINLQQGGAETRLSGTGTQLTGRDVTLNALDEGEIAGRAFALSASGVAAGAIGIVVNTAQMRIVNDIQGSAVLARRNIVIRARSAGGLSGLALSVAGSGAAAVTGSATTNKAANTVSTVLRGNTESSAPQRSLVLAKGTVALLSEAETTITLKGGGTDKLLSATGAVAVGAKAGVGGAVAVNLNQNTVETKLLSGGYEVTQVQGFGAETLSLDGVSRRGVVIAATSKTDLNIWAMSAGASAGLGASGLVVVNKGSDSAQVVLGDGKEVAVGMMASLSSLSPDAQLRAGLQVLNGGATLTANALSRTEIDAKTVSDIHSYAMSVGLGGAVGAGGAVVTNLLNGRAVTLAHGAQIAGEASVALRANVVNRIEVMSVGVAGGKFAGSASFAYNAINTTSKVDLAGTPVTARGRAPASGGAVVSAGEVVVDAATQNTVTGTLVGSAAVGAGAGTGAVTVTVLASTTEVETRRVVAPRRAFDPSSAAYVVTATPLDSTLLARGDVALSARTINTLGGRSVSGAAGGIAGAVSVAVDLVTTRSTLRVGADQKIQGAAVDLRADEVSTLSPTVGAVAAGGGAGAGSLSYMDFGGNSSVLVGARAEIVARKDLTIDAKALRIADVTAAAGALGSVAINGVISLMRVGGVTTDSSGVGATILARAQADMARSSADGSRAGAPTGSLDYLSAQTGAQGTISAVNDDQKARRHSLDVARTDNVGVVIGAAALLRSDGDIAITANSQSDLTQTVGTASMGLVGLAAAVGTVKLASTAQVAVNSGARVLSDKTVRIAAETGGRPTAAGPTHAVTSTVYALGGGALASVGAGVSLVENQSNARVSVSEGAVLGTQSSLITPATGQIADAAQKLQILARRSEAVRAKILNLTVSGGAAVGVTIAKVSNTGRADVTLGSTAGGAVTLKSGDLSLAAQDDSAAAASTLSAAGGTLAGMNGAFARAQNSGQSVVTLRRVSAEALRFGVTNRSKARASAEAKGLALGALAVGVMLTEAELNSTLTTTLTGVAVSADLIQISTELAAPDPVNSVRQANVSARSVSGAGGLVAGAGARAVSSSAYRVTTNVADDTQMQTRLNGRFGLLISNRARGVHTSATASGKSAGLLAVGATVAEAGQRGARKAIVETNLSSGKLTSLGRVEVDNANRQVVSVSVTAGAGGLVAGSGATARSYVAAETRITTGQAGDTQILAGDPTAPESTRLNGSVALISRQDAEIANQIDNRSASLVGVSVALSETQVSVDTSTTVGGQTTLRGNDFSVIAQNRFDLGSGVLSGSGGLAAGAGVSSSVRINALKQKVTLADGARLTQIGDPDLASINMIGATAVITLKDRVTIDAKGAGVLPYGQSALLAAQDSQVVIGRATVVSQGELRIFTGARVQMSSIALATASGAAGLAFARSTTSYTANNLIGIQTGANLLSFTGISLLADSAGAGAQRISVQAEARVFNRTAVPLASSPFAQAASDIDAEVKIAAGANVIAYEDVTVSATKGQVDQRGFATSKDFYKEIIGKVASAVGASLVLETKKERSIEAGEGKVVVNGQLRAGAFNRWVLYFDGSDQLNNALLETEARIGVFESAAHAPPSGKYSVQRNVDVAASILVEIDETRARIADPATSADDVARLRAHLGVLSRRHAALNGTRSTVITAGGLRASEGSVRITADSLTGAASGVVGAAGEADIRIYVSSGAMLDVTDLTISDVVGGDVTFNGTRLAAGRSTFGFTVDLAAQVDGRNTIQLINQGRADGGTSAADRGDLSILGKVRNGSGDVEIRTDLGSIMQRGLVDGVNTDFKAPKGSLSVAPIAGVDNKGASPQIVNRDYLNFQQSEARLGYWRQIFFNAGRDVPSFAYAQRVAQFTQPRPTASIVAGENIVLLAEYTNINTTISAGTGAYKVDIKAGIDSVLTQLRAAGGSGRVRLLNSSAAGPSNAIRTSFIGAETNAEVYFSYDTGQIEIDNMRVRGGGIYIVSNVISTGNGALRAIDGFGSVDINSESSFDVVLKGIDLGGRSDGTGLTGVIQITDLSKRSTTLDPARSAPGAPVYMPLITEYRSVGGTVTQLNNNVTSSGGAGYDHSTGTLLNVVHTYAPAANGTRPDIQYQTVQGRDYLVRSEVVRLVKMEQFDINIVKGNWGWVKDLGRDIGLTRFYRWDKLGSHGQSEAGVVQGSERTLISTFNAPQIVRSLNGMAYDYAYNGDFKTTQLTWATATGYQVTNRDNSTVNIGASQELRELMRATPGHPSGNAHLSKDPASGFDRVANIFPGNQGLYGLIYELSSNPGISQDELNVRHKIFDRRVAVFAEREYHEHRFNASKAISVGFSASDSKQNSRIVARGNVIFGSNFGNRYATTEVTSTAGSILTASDRVTLNTGNLVLTAAQRIGGVQGAMRVAMTKDTNSGDAIVTPAVLSATAGTGIDIVEVAGDLHLAKAVTTVRTPDSSGALQGAISLRATGDLIQNASAPAVAGSNVTLTSDGGAIYKATPGTAFDIDTQGGRLNARAQGDVTLRETVGDLGIGTVQSVAGNVTLSVPGGRITDRNNAEVRDTRTATELTNLWTADLGLIRGTTQLASRDQQHVQALKDRVTGQYQRYWSARTAAGGAAQSFALDETTEKQMRAAQPDGRIIDKYIARNRALYALWNTQSAYDSAYIAGYAPGQDEIDETLRGSAWTLDELRGAVRADLVLETADTKLRIEDPNISAAGDIVLTAQGIGEIAAPYVLRKPAAGGRFTAQDLAILALADASDFDIDGDGKPDLDADGNTLIRQKEDVNFALKEDSAGRAIGSISANVSAHEIYLAAETSGRVKRISGPGRVELRLDGAMIDAGAAQPAVRGQQIVLESGSRASIGSAAAPLRVDVIAGGGVSLRSGTEAYLHAPALVGTAGDLPLDAAYAAEKLRLSADGAITAAKPGQVERVISADIGLRAASIGTSTQALGLRQSAGALRTAQLTAQRGAVHVFTASDLVLGAIDSHTGGQLTTRDGATLDLRNAGRSRFAANASFTLDLAGPVLAAGTAPALSGGHLILRSSDAVGTQAAPLRVNVSALTVGPAASPVRAEDIWLHNTGALTVNTVTQSAFASAATSIHSTGDLRLTTATAAGRVTLSSDANVDIRRAQVGQLALRAGGVITGGSDSALVVQTLDLEARSGSASVVLGGAATVVNSATLGGTLTLAAQGVDLTVAGQGLAVTGRVQITTDRAFALNKASQVGSLVLSAQSVGLGEAATLTASGDLSVKSAGAITLGARSVMRGGAVVMTGKTLNLAAAAGLSAAGALTATLSDAVTLAAGAVLSAEDVTVKAASVTLGEGASAKAQGQLQATITGAAQLGANAALSGKGVTLSAGAVTFGEGASVKAQYQFSATAAGAMTLGARAALSGASLALDLGALTLSEAATLTASGDLRVKSADTIILGARSTVRGRATVVTGKALSLAAGAGLDAVGALTITLSDAVAMGAGAKLSAEAVTVNAASVTLGEGALVKAQTQTKATIGGAVQLGAKAALSGTSITFAAGSVILGAEALVKAQGQIAATIGGAAQLGAKAALSGTDITLAAGSVTLGAEASVKAQSQLNVTTGAGQLGAKAALSGAVLALDLAELTLSEEARLSAAQSLRASVSGDLRSAAGAVIETTAGALALTVGGDAQLARVSSGGTGQDALSLTVKGALRAATPDAPTVIATQTGALTTLRLGAAPAEGPGGLLVSVARLDARVLAGDLHLRTSGSVTVEALNADAGTADLFAAKDITLRQVSARDVVVVTAGGTLRADAAQIAASRAYLLALGGAMTGETGPQFAADAAEGTTLHLMAKGDLRYAETKGDARIAYAISQTGSTDASARGAGRKLRVDRVGAAQALTLRAEGGTQIGQIGGAPLDLIDEGTLRLAYAGPNPYGAIAVLEPKDLVVSAQGPGASITIDGLRARKVLNLQADRISARIIDDTPEDGLELSVSGWNGGAAREVSIEVETPNTAVHLAHGRFETGTIRVAGPTLKVSDVVIGDAAWFYQQGFGLYATSGLRAPQSGADAQLIALAVEDGALVTGRVAFELSDAAALNTSGLVLRRATLDVIVNNARPFSADILEELVQTMRPSTREAARKTLAELFDLASQLSQGTEAQEVDGVVQLPMIMAANL